MSHLQYFNYPGFGERAKTEVHYSQSVRIDNRIEISGQGGWDRVTEEFPKDLGEEVNQAFDNVQHTLEKAGGKGWDQVYKVRVYVSKNAESSFLDAMGHVIRNLTQWCPNHEPLLTAVEVAGLYNDMRIEIEAEAHLG